MGQQAFKCVQGWESKCGRSFLHVDAWESVFLYVSLRVHVGIGDL